MLLNYKYGAVGLCFLGMTGCMNLNPEYSQPTSPVATSFNNQAVGGALLNQLQIYSGALFFLILAYKKSLRCL